MKDDEMKNPNQVTAASLDPEQTTPVENTPSAAVSMATTAELGPTTPKTSGKASFWKKWWVVILLVGVLLIAGGAWVVASTGVSLKLGPIQIGEPEVFTHLEEDDSWGIPYYHTNAQILVKAEYDNRESIHVANIMDATEHYGYSFYDDGQVVFWDYNREQVEPVYKMKASELSQMKELISQIEKDDVAEICEEETELTETALGLRIFAYLTNDDEQLVVNYGCYDGEEPNVMLLRLLQQIFAQQGWKIQIDLPDFEAYAEQERLGTNKMSNPGLLAGLSTRQMGRLGNVWGFAYTDDAWLEEEADGINRLLAYNTNQDIIQVLTYQGQGHALGYYLNKIYLGILETNPQTGVTSYKIKSMDLDNGNFVLQDVAYSNDVMELCRQFMWCTDVDTFEVDYPYVMNGKLYYQGWYADRYLDGIGEPQEMVSHVLFELDLSQSTDLRNSRPIFEIEEGDGELLQLASDSYFKVIDLDGKEVSLANKIIYGAEGETSATNDSINGPYDFDFLKAQVVNVAEI